MFPITLPDFNNSWRFWTKFRSGSPCRVSRKCVQWGAALIHADSRADGHNAFRANAPKKNRLSKCV